MDIPFRRQIIGASKTQGGKSPSMLPGNSSVRYSAKRNPKELSVQNSNAVPEYFAERRK
jgi:hypothetical protein